MPQRWAYNQVEDFFNWYRNLNQDDRVGICLGKTIEFKTFIEHYQNIPKTKTQDNEKTINTY